MEEISKHRTSSGLNQEVIHRKSVTANLRNYEKEREQFKWKDFEKEFSWHTTGKINAVHECIDRHCETERRNKVALYFEDDTGLKKFTFQEMKNLSNQFANVLTENEIEKGDRVFVFLPRSPELYVAFMGIGKIGAVVGPMFEAFMEDALRDRLQNCGAKAIVTTPELMQRIPFKDLPALELVVVVGEWRGCGNEGGVCELPKGKRVSTVAESAAERGFGGKLISWEKEMKNASRKFDVVFVDGEDPLVIHYTSGSTGKPKGAMHVHNSMLGHLVTGKYTLDLRNEDVYWCTADPGWVTGTNYGIYAPWLNGCSIVVRGGRFDADKWYKTLQDLGVNVWYSAPTAFRMMMAAGASKAKQYDLSAIRCIYSVGEPLNPEVVKWGLEAFGKPIMENWWMTETGMHLICNFPCLTLKLGSMGKPFPGVEAAIIDETGRKLPPYEIGNLAVKKGWPSMMRGIWGDEQKFRSYFVGEKNEWYVSGDSAYMDEEGYFFFEGRIDDVIKTSGERVGPFEVESALVEHPAVAEAGVIGKPDAMRGNVIKAFVSLRAGFAQSEALKTELMEFVKTKLAAHAKPREIEFVEKLPKTRSGKIMRRVLRAKELGLPMGDLSTLDD